MSVTVVLTCGHELLFRYSPPQVGRNVYCIRCDDMARVAGGPGDWRAVCDMCTFRRTRRTQEAIRDNMLHHLQTCPAHVITLWQVGRENRSYKVTQKEPTTTTGQPWTEPDTLF